jgi:hypothetical protein
MRATGAICWLRCDPWLGWLAWEEHVDTAEDDETAVVWEGREVCGEGFCGSEALGDGVCRGKDVGLIGCCLGATVLGD